MPAAKKTTDRPMWDGFPATKILREAGFTYYGDSEDWAAGTWGRQLEKGVDAVVAIPEGAQVRLGRAYLFREDDPVLLAVVSEDGFSRSSLEGVPLREAFGLVDGLKAELAAQRAEAEAAREDIEVRRSPLGVVVHPACDKPEWSLQPGVMARGDAQEKLCSFCEKPLAEAAQ